jgi:hypothetical protein
MERIMKRIFFLMITLTIILAIALPAAAGTGNGAPSGSHYNLNIIGIPKNKTATMDNNDGHRIFVPLEGKSNIWLKEGDDFDVLDANGTDGNGASFQLPNPDPDNDGITEYSVWARALGKPGGSSTTTTCAYVDTELWCSVYSMVLVRDKGASKFTNVTKQLLYVYVDLNADGTVERYPLFSDAMVNYFWSYDNNGLKLAQLRFYEVSTDVN